MTRRNDPFITDFYVWIKRLADLIGINRIAEIDSLFWILPEG